MAAPTIWPMSRSLLSLTEARAKRPLRHDHVLHVAEKIEAPVAAFAADPRSLDAAERRGQIADAEAVDPDEAAAHALRDVGRVLGRAVADAAEAVVGAVGERDRLIVAIEGLQRQHRAEDFALHDLAVLRDGGEPGRLVVLRAVAMRRTAPHERRAGGERALHETVDALDLARMDDRPDLGRFIARIADDEPLDMATQEVDEAISDAGVHQQPRAGEADLAGVAVHQRRR